MTDPSILFIKPGAILAEDKAALKEAGVIVVETDDPASIKLIRAGMELSHSDLLGCAGTALLRSQDAMTAFGKAVATAIGARHAE